VGDPRPVGYVVGLLLVALAAMMLFPAALDLATGDRNWMAFAQSAVVTALTGAAVALSCANGAGRAMTIRHAFVLTVAAWVMLPVFGALPMVLGAPQARFIDAFFEAMSGMTTTGTTVFAGLDDLPRGTNLWRVILHWLGGLGIVIVALLFLPLMKIGGMQFFRSEGFDTLGKVLPRAFDISLALIQLYVVLTVTCVLTYFALGMTGYEAVVHGMSTISTGGFSSSDRSFGLFLGAPEYAAVVFMLLASMPFVRFIQVMQGQWTPLWRDPQVRAYLRWNLYAAAAVAAWLMWHEGQPAEPAIREALFNIASTFSGTGFASVDLTTWGTFPFVLLIAVGLIGGCTSSTGCSVKVFRFLILFEAVRVQVRRLQSPNAVVSVRYDGRRVDDDVINSVIVFFTMFILSFGVLAVALSMTGLQGRTAVTAAWTAIANVGPVFGPEVGPTGAVGGFPDAAKALMILGMLAGRLELIAVFVLLLPRFWRA
jgi:trk system potassium uptake protein TrkH